MLKRTLEPEVMDTYEEAAEYDAMDHSAVNRQFAEDLLQQGDLGEELLDIGTGSARIPIEICQSREDVRIVAADLSPSMLDIAKINLELSNTTERIILSLVDAKEMPFEDGRFSTTISNSIVHHIPNPIEVLSEAVRVTGDGGLIFFRDLMRPDSEPSVDQLVSTYTRKETDNAQRLFRESLHAALTLEEMRDLVQQLGFDRETVGVTSDRHWTWSARK